MRCLVRKRGGSNFNMNLKNDIRIAIIWLLLVSSCGVCWAVEAATPLDRRIAAAAKTENVRYEDALRNAFGVLRPEVADCEYVKFKEKWTPSRLREFNGNLVEVLIDDSWKARGLNGPHKLLVRFMRNGDGKVAIPEVVIIRDFENPVKVGENIKEYEGESALGVLLGSKEIQKVAGEWVWIQGVELSFMALKDSDRLISTLGFEAVVKFSMVKNSPSERRLVSFRAFCGKDAILGWDGRLLSKPTGQLFRSEIAKSGVKADKATWFSWGESQVRTVQ